MNTRYMFNIARSFALNEYRALLRSPVSMVFYFGVPALMSAILGPAVTGLDGKGASSRGMIGLAVMFAYAGVNYVGRALFREYSNYTWSRTAIVHPPRLAYLGGKCFAIFTVSLGQLLTFTAIAYLFLDLRVETWPDALGLTAVFVVHSATAVAVGALLFTLVDSAEAFYSLNLLVLISFGTLGGSMVASSQLPAWAEKVGVFTPHHWTMRAVDDIVVGSASPGTTMTSAVVLVAIFALLMGKAIHGFDYRIEKLDDE